MGELVAPGMAAEIVAIIEHQDPRAGDGAAIKPGRCEPADAAADHDEVVVFVNAGIAGMEIDPAPGQSVRDRESAVNLAAQPGERRRIERRRRELRGRRQPGADRQGHAVEKIPPRYFAHASTIARPRTTSPAAGRSGRSRRA